MKDTVAVRLTNVSKEYNIHHEKPTLVEKFVKGKEERFFALDNISFVINKGESVGFIGPNGSGKTTLLKLIAGITVPSGGTVTTSGRIVSLIDLSAGFHPDLTGYQNIYLNGMLAGMSREEITSQVSSIIEFAGIRQFIDTPMFTYSNGMTLRLGFSIAVHSDPDIILLDEGISVGDSSFQEKSLQTIYRFIRLKKTVIVVSHWFEQMKKFTSRIIWFESGRIRQNGSNKVINNYLRHIQKHRPG